MRELDRPARDCSCFFVWSARVPPLKYLSLCSRAVADQQVARNNDLDNVHLLEAADEWPFLREMVGGADGGEAGEGAGQESKQEHLLCDALVGEPFYYRVSGTVGLLRLICVLGLVLAKGGTWFVFRDMAQFSAQEVRAPEHSFDSVLCLDNAHATALFPALGESHGVNSYTGRCSLMTVYNTQMQSLVLYEAMNFWYLRRVFHPALKPDAR